MIFSLFCCLKLSATNTSLKQSSIFLFFEEVEQASSLLSAEIKKPHLICPESLSSPWFVSQTDCGIKVIKRPIKYKIQTLGSKGSFPCRVVKLLWAHAAFFFSLMKLVFASQWEVIGAVGFLWYLNACQSY